MIKDFAVFVRDNKFARKTAESFRRRRVEPKKLVENFGFKVGDFFEKTTCLAVVIRIEKRENPPVLTGDKSQMIFIFVKQLNDNRLCGKFSVLLAAMQ